MRDPGVVLLDIQLPDLDGIELARRLPEPRPALVFLTAVKELPATLILAPIGFDTLAIDVWRTTSVGFYERGAVPSLLLLAVSAVPMAILVLRERSDA